MKGHRYTHQLAFSIISFLLLTFLCHADVHAVVDYSFSWDANHPNDNVVAYRIYWSTSSENYNASDREEVLVSSLGDPGNPQWTINIPDPPVGAFYFFVCTAVDDEGFESDHSFEIEAAAPRITSPPTVTDVTNSTVEISWSTDELADSQVHYGDNMASWGEYDANQTDAALVINHSVTLTGLASGTVHYYRVGSTNGEGRMRLFPEKGLFPPSRTRTRHHPSSPHRQRSFRKPAPPPPLSGRRMNHRTAESTTV